MVSVSLVFLVLVLVLVLVLDSMEVVLITSASTIRSSRHYCIGRRGRGS
jgi:hypothetical protein